jgi:hypothetical protein
MTNLEASNRKMNFRLLGNRLVIFGQQDRHGTIDSDGDQRLQRFFQLRGQLCADGADGDAGNVVEEIQLGHLLMPHDLRARKQCRHRKQGCE